MRTRAQRRRFRELAIARMRRHVSSWSSTAHTPEWIESFVRKAADNPALCSGLCCGNQRSVEGPSISELRRIHE